MKAMKTLYLCGASNPEGVRLALAVQRAAGRWDRLVLLDDDVARHGHAVLGVDVAGPFAALAEARPQDSEVACLVARTTRKRAAARARLQAYGLTPAALVDPGVDTSGVELSDELTLYEQASVCPGSAMGSGTVVFLHAIVGHGCRVGPGCVIGPGAVLNARVELAEGVYVGSNATVLPEIRVGAWATIGAGSVVLQDVPPGATVFGVPAQILARGEESVASSSGAMAPGALRTEAELERAIAALWCEVLDLAAVDTQVNFFDLGGNSLRALQVCARIRETIHRELAITDLFRFPTVRALARHMSTGTRSGTEPLRSAPEDRGALRRRMLLARQRIGD